MNAISHYRQKLRDKGIAEILIGRWRWYKTSLQIDNWYVGRLIEIFGDRIKLENIILSVDNPLVSTRHKCTLYFGLYENAERHFCRNYLDRSLPIIEIGASIGGISCFTNKMLENPQDHVVVECNPLLLPTLRKNRKLNGCTFQIEPLAIAYGTDSVTFDVPNNFLAGRIGGDSESSVAVRTTSVSTLIANYEFDVINLICDCEGMEVEIIENEATALRDHVRCLILETHPNFRGEEAIGGALAILKEIGFESQESPRDHVYAFINRRIAAS